MNALPERGFRQANSHSQLLKFFQPADCFDTALEAVRIALTYRTPVILLSDGFIANSSEAWRIPSIDDIPDLSIPPIEHGESYVPYQRDPKTLARRLAIPGRPGFEHRIGGLEKNDSGMVSHDPLNHQKMVQLRAQKVEGIAHTIPPLKIFGSNEGKVLVVGWGNTKGAITAAVQKLQDDGQSVSSIHLRHINPLPSDLGDILKRFDKILLPELNLGQMAMILRSKYLIDIISYSKVQGKPLKIFELIKAIYDLL